MTLEEMQKMVENTWNSIPGRNLTLHTGKSGAINFQESISGKKLTQEEKDKYKEGVYEISTINGLRYLGKYE